MLLASPTRLPVSAATTSPVASPLALAMFPESAVLAATRPTTTTMMTMLGLLTLPVAAAAARRLTLLLPRVLLAGTIVSSHFARG